MNLTAKRCIACRGGIPPLSLKAATQYHLQTPQWELRDNATKMTRRFKFSNFGEALAFVQKVSELAETEGHHPDITFGWGYCEILLYTHKIKGLHENDFIIAAKVDALVN